jgi:hypothetical protein
MDSPYQTVTLEFEGKLESIEYMCTRIKFIHMNWHDEYQNTVSKRIKSITLLHDRMSHNRNKSEY